MGDDAATLSALLNASRGIQQIVAAIQSVFPRITTVQTTVGAAGPASALPATPLAYLNVTLPDGRAGVIPVYNP